ncbi:MAG: leucyl aminopeptidase [Gammaproteobacteria bacterium]|nr:leucyl aminopeptidase [Gammaproteobacteria bacterium]
MEFSLQQDASQLDTAASLILPLTLAQDGSTPITSDALKRADVLLNGAISHAIASGDLSGKFKVSQLFLNAGSGPDRILVIGTGTADKLNGRKYGQLVQSAWAKISTNPGAHVANLLTTADSQALDISSKVRLTVESMVQACYRFDQFKTDNKDDPTNNTQATTMALAAGTETQTQLEQSVATATAMDLCRDLGNLPGNVCTPNFLAEQGHKLAASSSKVTTQVLEEAEMETLGMHSLLSVGKGSAEPSKLIVINYQGGEESARPHVLVGKGITFDSGGISIKPGAAMDEMKYDMCGAASVIGAMQAVINMDLKANVVAIVASAENMPSSTASKPGDIYTTMSGKTVEVLNTDAEGRLVLCDALTYAERFNPKTVVDVATLTGACIIALGHHTSAVLSNDDQFAASIMTAGKQAFDQAWQLPMGDEYQEQLDSNFADLGNIGGRSAGTITAACFLSRFTQSYTWAHLDIAGTAWTSGAKKGSTGRCVPLLVQHLVNQV